MSPTQLRQARVPVQAGKLTATMAGLVCQVTGATSGIGRATALEFARSEATVAIVARSEERGRATLRQIVSATGNEDVFLFVADLSSQAAVRALSDDFARRFDRLNVLVNDAGVFVRRRLVTEDGLELMFATNQWAPFLLTLLLLPRLKAASPARIVNVTAPSTVRPDFHDLQGERRFRCSSPSTGSGGYEMNFAIGAFAWAEGTWPPSCGRWGWRRSIPSADSRSPIPATRSTPTSCGGWTLPGPGRCGAPT